MYLTQKHFNQSLGVAFGLHILFLIIYAINFPYDEPHVLDKPIYVKIGKSPDAGIGVKGGKEDSNSDAIRLIPKPTMKAQVIQPLEIIPTPKPQPQAQVNIEPTVQSQATDKIETNKEEVAKPEIKKAPLSMAKSSKSIPAPKSRPKSADAPLVQEFRPDSMTENPGDSNISVQDIPFVQHLLSKQYAVDGVESAEGDGKEGKITGIQGEKLGNRTEAEQIAITKYEQKLALWLQQHHYYPVAARERGLEGDALVRMQIDRLGNIRFYEVAEPSPHVMLDDAVIQMIERSDPVPPVPDDYPGDFVIEFLIPVSFKLK